MSKIDTKTVKSLAVELMSGLRKASSSFVSYNDKVSVIEGHTEHTREFKDSQIESEKQKLDAQIRVVYDGMYGSLEKLGTVLESNDNTYDFSDPEFASCIALMSASEKPLPSETILGIAEKFLGNRQALLALVEVAKGSNKQTLEERVFNSEKEVLALQDKVESLDFSFPKTAYMMPDIRSSILNIAKACGQALTEQEADCGTDYQEIVTLQMRAAMGLPNQVQ